ncbi:MAG: chitosanase [Candidatus Sumerlaeaceae bacterium]
MALAFRSGASGYLVRQLQSQLKVNCDGRYGARTEAAVSAVQKAHALSIDGAADELTYRAIRLQWPEEFERCLNVTSCLEGTSFGDCNATDIDGAGLTMGVAGFTTAHGEVQEILRDFFVANPRAAEFVSSECDASLRTLLASDAVNAEAWKSLFYAGEHVKNEWKAAIRAWGDTPEMQSVQKGLTRRCFWEPGLRMAKKLKLTSVSAHAFLFDVAVQNGGWSSRHERALASLKVTATHDESRRLANMAEAVALCCAPQWRWDVRARKMLFATGSGLVHGRHYKLRTYALAP